MPVAARPPAGGAAAFPVICPNAALAFAALTALLFIPLFGSKAALVFLLAGLALLLRRPRALPGEATMAWPLWLLAAWCLASVVWSDEPALTLRYAVQLALTLAIAVAMAARLAPSVFLGAVLLAYGAAALASLAAGRARSDGLGYLGIFNSKNALANAGSILLLAGLCLAIDRRIPAPWRLAGAAGAGLGAALVLMANSVGGAVACAAVLGALGLVLLLRRLAPGLRLLAGTLGLLAAGLGALALLAHIDALAALFLDATGKDFTLTGRTELWRIALDEIARRPLLGAGYQAVWVPGNPLAEMLWAEFGVESRTGFHFHNALLSNAVEIGLPAAALQALLVVGALAAATAAALRDARAETLFVALFLVRQIVLSLIEVPYFLQFDHGTVLTVAAIVHAARMRRAGAR
ncbi:MAG: O-antigen ligase family protein [Rhodobacteraceae bacterium]|nr:O-antigen ligase family protein [Paracoccaceae bacterium]